MDFNTGVSLKELFLSLLLFGMSVFCRSDCFAFNYEKCSKIGVGNGVGYFFSTTSYVSSTGPCSMLGSVENSRKVFFAQNFDKILDDFSKGSGEYAQSFAFMNGCSHEVQIMYPRLMQKNFINLLNSYNSDQPEQTFQKLMDYFNHEPILVGGCKSKGV